MNKLFFTFVSLFITSYLFADGGEMRPATRAEKDFTVKVITTIIKAVPESFTGFKRKETTEPIEPKYIDAGTENSPMHISFSGQWINEEMERQSNEKIQNMADNSKGSIEKNPELQANIKKRNEITAQISKAAEENDQKKLEKLAKEFEALAKEMETILQPAALQTISDTKHEISLSIEVNSLRYEISQCDIAPMKPVMGYKVFSYHDKSNKYTDKLLIFMGNWSNNVHNGQMIFTLNKKNIPHTSVQSYIITVTGDKTYTQKFVDNLDLKMMKNILR